MLPSARDPLSAALPHLALLARPGRVLRAALLGLGIAATIAPVAPAQAAPGQKDGKGQKKKGSKAPPAPVKSTAAAAAPARAIAGKAAATPIELHLPIQRATLDNGMRVVLNPDHTAPTVAVAVVYDVGSRSEQRGRSGFAHLFEHMMFQGSKNLSKGEHSRLVSGHGGVLNGTTNTDRTNYFEILPANELALGLWLEADRLKSLDVSEANFENQRKVVEEEYRMRVSNVAYGPSEIRLEELVYQGYWPYEHDTIGSMADLDGAKFEWVQAFHAHHYGPNNAVVAVAGDFDPAEAMAMIHRYFDGVPKVEITPVEEIPFPEQTSQRTAVVRDDNARTPGVLYGWAIPPLRGADHYALEMTALLLGGGESSRLHQLLVRDRAVAQEVSASTDNRRGPDLFVLDAHLADGAKVVDVEKLVEGELKALSTRGPSDAEVDKARRRVEASLVLALQSNGARARRLGDYEVFFGDARHLNAELPRYLAVTKDDIKRVAAQYLGPTRRSIVETYPAADADKQASSTDKGAGAAVAAPGPGGDKVKKAAKAPAAPDPKAKKGGSAAPTSKPKKPKKG